MRGEFSDLLFESAVINGADLVNKDIGISVDSGLVLGDMNPQDSGTFRDFGCHRANNRAGVCVI